jgi:NitT/TauT family transport system permease protein
LKKLINFTMGFYNFNKFLIVKFIPLLLVLGVFLSFAVDSSYILGSYSHLYFSSAEKLGSSNFQNYINGLIFFELIVLALFIFSSLIIGSICAIKNEDNIENLSVFVFLKELDEKITVFIQRHVWGIFAEPPKWFAVIAKLSLFVIVFFSYVSYSEYQTSLDKRQKIYPSIEKMAKKTEKNFLFPDKRVSFKNMNNENNKIIKSNEQITISNKNKNFTYTDKINSVGDKNHLLVMENAKIITINKERESDDKLLLKNLLISKSDYELWKPINKKIIKIKKEIKNAKESELPTFDLVLEKWSLQIDAYSLGMGNSLAWVDTKSSLYRLIISMLIAATFSLFVALYMGMYRMVDYTMNDFSTVISLIQPVAILPIIMIVFGVEDYGKIIFIVLGTIPPMLLSTYLSVKAVPKQTIIKGKTLGASDFQVMRTVVLPQVMPHFINTVRLTLFLGWMLLLTSEMVSSESGLGYRILVEKRFVNMDAIIPYVLWIMSMSYLTDKLLKLTTAKLYPWHMAK